MAGAQAWVLCVTCQGPFSPKTMATTFSADLHYREPLPVAPPCRLLQTRRSTSESLRAWVRRRGLWPYNGLYAFVTAFPPPSTQARFALKYHCVKYSTTPYMPLFGELRLRLRLWEWRRKLSVPVMFTPSDGVLLQSYDIATWADSHSARPDAVRLFPEGKEAEVSR
jgi:hypothetical protein